MARCISQTKHDQEAAAIAAKRAAALREADEGKPAQRAARIAKAHRTYDSEMARLNRKPICP